MSESLFTRLVRAFRGDANGQATFPAKVAEEGAGATFEEEYKKLFEEKGDLAVEEALARLTKLYGAPPLVSRVLSEDKEIFVAAAMKNRAIFHKETSPLDEKVVELVTIGAATALRCEHCLDVHIKRAFSLGAAKEEILQSIMIASAITESASWATAFRKYRQAVAKRESKEE